MANTWAVDEATGRRITGTVNQVGVGQGAPDWAAQEWRVSLRCEGRRMTLRYYGGGSASDPSIGDVVETLAMDAYSIGETFESWCQDLGYDTDSRKAHATYRAVVRISRRFNRLRGLSVA